MQFVYSPLGEKPNRNEPFVPLRRKSDLFNPWLFDIFAAEKISNVIDSDFCGLLYINHNSSFESLYPSPRHNSSRN
jgi:hypothetical protein